MLDAQQNGWNVGYDLAMTLAVIGISLSGDPITTKMSIGCDATPRTSALGSLLGQELGVDAHNVSSHPTTLSPFPTQLTTNTQQKFEADTSLSRSDYFLATPDAFTFNTTLFAQMTTTTAGDFNLPNTVKFMSQRYADSKTNNPNFYFGPKAILLYGAASFLFRLFPNFESGDTAPANLQNIGPFFGAVQTSSPGAQELVFKFSGGERFPDEWHNRHTPLTLANVADDFLTMYTLNPVLLGGNVGKNNFDALGPAAGNGVSGVNNTDSTFSGATERDIICLLYQIATEDVPSSLQTGLGDLPAEVVAFAAGKLNLLEVFVDAGCTLKPLGGA